MTAEEDSTDLATWDDDSWRRFRNYADRVEIILNFVEYPTEVGDEVWVLQTVGANWDEDWLIREVEQLTRAEDGTPAPYVLRVEETHFTWGADAALLKVLLDAAAGLLGAATWDGIRRLPQRLSERLTQSDGHPLTEQEAIERARMLLTERYR